MMKVHRYNYKTDDKFTASRKKNEEVYTFVYNTLKDQLEWDEDKAVHVANIALEGLRAGNQVYAGDYLFTLELENGEAYEKVDRVIPDLPEGMERKTNGLKEKREARAKEKPTEPETEVKEVKARKA